MSKNYHGMIEDTVEEQRSRDAWRQRRQEEEDAENKAHSDKVKIISFVIYLVWCAFGFAVFPKDSNISVCWGLFGLIAVPLAVVSFFEKRD